MSTIPATIEQRPLGRTGQMVSILGFVWLASQGAQ